MNMHHEIQDGLEDFLAGTADPNGRIRIESHLRECTGCRQEVESMQEMAELFSSLRSPDPPLPAPGFYARVNRLIEQQQPAPFWAAAMEPFFGKRLALASLLVMATLGTVLVSRETDEYAVGPSPEMILAAETDASAPATTPAIERAQMLVTLASHRQ
jgi:predicted anti-sigma-YlaC factor YlaD